VIFTRGKLELGDKRRDGKELVCENEDIPGDDAAVVEVEFAKRVLGNCLLFETNNVEGRVRLWGNLRR
jgi:hypothetical protein